MSSSLEEQFEQTREEFRRKREDLRDVQAKMAGISVSVTAPRRVVEVTVGRNGDVTDVSFPSGAYKSMVPSELAKVVLETVRNAQEKAREELAQLMEPMMPAGFAVRDLLAGKADLDAMLPDDAGPGMFLRHDRLR
ncbi:YbaB/EbfC family nucleoid-associated protein [Lentzea sp.]|uniref:YbaB/EbfC family nucleoid-associated protein n=1 Tax=Lentzea sp. TaxID=56099 RepID=UPI002C414FCD|nr:YbaB/EbfC family nucleoid-associated protein [Lentzea sp.]HUQ54865.1 YbaB/EbfC family nucleoid-associated protein [Lentzea sp.]